MIQRFEQDRVLCYLMARRGHGFGSRDYHAPRIECDRTSCNANASGTCGMVSAIKINAQGQCKFGLDNIRESALILHTLRNPREGD